MTVHLTATGSFLPGDPVDNDLMESRLGLVGGHESRYRRLVLRNNGIRSRYYAIDDDGNQTHLNEELAAHAIERAVEDRGLGLNEIDMLAVGTTIPDILMPGFGTMVHGRLGTNTGQVGPMEVLTTAGICTSGAAALQHAWTAVLAGRHDRVVACGSELLSPMMRSSRFEHESEVHGDREVTPDGFQYFNADFLRWMLSDGAGAVVLEREPNPDRLSLRVDWVELTSYAHELPVCMHFGTSDPKDISVGKTWLSVENGGVAHEQGMLFIRQDTNLLAQNIIRVGCEEVRRLIKRGRVDPDLGYDWVLPHLSSYFFKDKMAKGFREVGLDLPDERWFTNLSTKGNTGAASIYIMLDEALRSGRFERGDRILGIVPESGRFTMSFMQFTCV
jgi:3-oxoacyl-[acyl-carrier-protein] synthase III